MALGTDTVNGTLVTPDGATAEPPVYSVAESLWLFDTHTGEVGNFDIPQGLRRSAVDNRRPETVAIGDEIRLRDRHW